MVHYLFPCPLISLGESLTLSVDYPQCEGGVYEWSNGVLGNSIFVSPTTNTDYTVRCKIGQCYGLVSSTFSVLVRCGNVAPPSISLVPTGDNYFPSYKLVSNCASETVWYENTPIYNVNNNVTGFRKCFKAKDSYLGSFTNEYQYVSAICSQQGCISEQSPVFNVRDTIQVRNTPLPYNNNCILNGRPLFDQFGNGVYSTQCGESIVYKISNCQANTLSCSY